MSIDMFPDAAIDYMAGYPSEVTTRTRKEQTVPKTATPKDPVEVEAEANAEAAEQDKSAETKCDNHPGRYGRNFTGGGSYSINLCDECLEATPWLAGSASE